MPTVLIAGASGLVGEAAVEHFSRAPGWHVIAVSRRPPKVGEASAITHVSIDLLDRDRSRSGLGKCADVTHAIYAASTEAPGLRSGWLDAQQIARNAAMFQNLLDPLCSTQSLRHVMLLQGAKAYGAHAGLQPRLPAREDTDRSRHENFYWRQEDHLRAMASRHGFAWTIFRPAVVIGATWGASMNPLVALGALAAIRRHEGKPLAYPGGAFQVSELVGNDLLAEAFEWAANDPAAINQTFNITNGEVFAWRDSWGDLAQLLGVEQGNDEAMSVADYLESRSALWEELVIAHGLCPLPLATLLGQSHHYLDMLLRRLAITIEYPTLMSTIKLRQKGFAACRDNRAMFERSIDQLRRRKLIPAE